jgi:hypothetical protein
MKTTYGASLAEPMTSDPGLKVVEQPAQTFPAPAPDSAAAASFGPDVLLPDQFFGRSNVLEEVSGERALMLAVLEDGIRCFQENLANPRVRARLMARQAEKWIRSADWDWPFSFNNICESLELDAESLRRRLLAGEECENGGERPRRSSHRVYRLTPRVKLPRKR